MIGMTNVFGAEANSRFTHLAISTSIQKGDVVWLERVSDAEYDGLSRKDGK